MEALLVSLVLKSQNIFQPPAVIFVLFTLETEILKFADKKAGALPVPVESVVFLTVNIQNIIICICA